MLPALRVRLQWPVLTWTVAAQTCDHSPAGVFRVVTRLPLVQPAQMPCCPQTRCWALFSPTTPRTVRPSLSEPAERQAKAGAGAPREQRGQGRQPPLSRPNAAATRRKQTMADCRQRGVSQHAAPPSAEAARRAPAPARSWPMRFSDPQRGRAPRATPRGGDRLRRDHRRARRVRRLSTAGRSG